MLKPSEREKTAGLPAVGSIRAQHPDRIPRGRGPGIADIDQVFPRRRPDPHAPTARLISCISRISNNLGQRLPVTNRRSPSASYAIPLSTSVCSVRSAGRQQAGEIDPADDLAGRRVDARDAVGLPDVGVDLALHPFQFVQFADRPALVGDGDAAGLLERLGIPEAQLRRLPSLMMMRLPSVVSPQPSPG